MMIRRGDVHDRARRRLLVHRCVSVDCRASRGNGEHMRHEGIELGALKNAAKMPRSPRSIDELSSLRAYLVLRACLHAWLQLPNHHPTIPIPYLGYGPVSYGYRQQHGPFSHTNVDPEFSTGLDWTQYDVPQLTHGLRPSLSNSPRISRSVKTTNG